MLLDALLASKRISDVIILTSPNTPKTYNYACINRDIQFFKHPEMVILKIYNIIFPNVFHLIQTRLY